MDLLAEGMSSPGGFSITVWNEKTGLRVAGQTPQHNMESLTQRTLRLRCNPLLIVGYIALCLAGITGVLAAVYFFRSPGTLGSIIFWSCVPLFVFGWIRAANELIEALYIFWHRELARWHGCEHKLIALYLNGEPRIYENIKKAPRTSSACGSMEGFWVVVLPLIPLSVLTAHFIGSRIFSWDVLSIIMTGVALIVITLLSIFRGPLVLQWLLATSEPSPSQYKEALELAARMDIVLTLDEITSPKNASHWEAQFCPRRSALAPPLGGVNQQQSAITSRSTSPSSPALPPQARHGIFPVPYAAILQVLRRTICLTPACAR